jgi:hypothetical protein
MNRECAFCKHWECLSHSDYGFCGAIFESGGDPPKAKARLTDEGTLLTERHFFCAMFEETTKP